MLEKLFVNRLQWQLGREGRLSPLQYGFTPQCSTEDALYDGLAVVRRNLEQKKIVVMVSLDIEGAFDNAWWPVIIQQLHEKKVDGVIVRLIVDYLSKRRVRLRYLGETIERDTNRGCIQGSTCGPILWNVLLDQVLEQTQYGGVRVQAFADDILMIAAASDGCKLEEKMNRALAVILQWGEKLKLKFAPGKTQALLITRKLKYHTPRLEMAGVELKYGASLRILGLTIDPMLSFRQHLEVMVKKVVAFYRVVSRAARAQWGLNSDILRLIYMAVVEPTVLYPAGCWADVSSKVYAETVLDRLTRSFAIRISKAHRTVSLVSSVLLARIIPLSLRVKEHSCVYRVKRGEELAGLPGRSIELRRSPYSLPHPAERLRLEFGLIKSREDVESLETDGLVLYTDGSKLEGKVGAAVSAWIDGVEVRYASFRLENFCSVFQAELSAILWALTIIRERKDRTVSIASDSRSGLEAICDPNSVNPLAVDIRAGISQLGVEGVVVTLFWVRAHCGIVGNERADELAKNAALKNKQLPRYDRFPLSFAKHSTRVNTLEEWQHTYETATSGSTTRLFFKSVKLAYGVLRELALDNYLAQIFTGHGGFRFYLHRFKLVESALCSCGEDVPQTLEHVLIGCSRFGKLRYDCECSIETEICLGNLAVIMLECGHRRIFLDFARAVLQRVGRENGSFVM